MIHGYNMTEPARVEKRSLSNGPGCVCGNWDTHMLPVTLQ